METRENNVAEKKESLDISLLSRIITIDLRLCGIRYFYI